MNPYSIRYTKRVLRDMKRVERRGKDLAELREVIRLLLTGEPLPPKYRDHALKGNWIGHRECHLAPDWLFIYKRVDREFVIVATATGTHSDLL